VIVVHSASTRPSVPCVMVGQAASKGNPKIGTRRAPGPGSGPASPEPASLCMDAMPLGAMKGFGGPSGPNASAARAGVIAGMRDTAHAVSTATGKASSALGNRIEVPSCDWGHPESDGH
jgi:hypothetical protein